jgi:beta-N-acetylhexosaminidase
MSSQSDRAPGRAGLFALLVGVALLAGACGSQSVPSAKPSQSTASLGITSPAPSSSQHPSALPSELPSELPSPIVTPIPSLSPSPTAQASCAQQVLRGMTVAQRIGQLFSLGLANDKLGTAELSAITNQHVGSVWFTATTSIGVAGIRTVTDAIQAQATEVATDGVRMYIAANQEGGQIQALRGTGFSTIPSAVVQGGRPISTLTSQARVWGSQLIAAGVNMDFAPVADVVPPGGESTNQPIGVLMREYGHDPTTAGTHAAAFIAGMTAAGIDTTAKHFPGLGRVLNNTDFSANVVDKVTTANDPYLGSFEDTIKAGVPFVMIALATYTKIDPNQLAAFSPTVINLLRTQLGFRGVIVSDSLTAAAVASMPAGDRAIDFLLAGGDVVVVRSASTMVAMVAAVQARAATDTTFLHLVNEAALLVLEAKSAAGLLPPGC